MSEEEKRARRAAYMRRYRRKQKTKRKEALDAAWESGVKAAVETYLEGV